MKILIAFSLFLFVGGGAIPAYSDSVIHEGSGAKVTIIEFGDFQCPFSKSGSTTIKEVAAAYGDRVKIVFLNFPLSFHKNARSSAVAGICAGDQGKFRRMYDYLYDNSARLSREIYLDGAKSLGLDIPRFEACLDSQWPRRIVHRDEETGRALGVVGPSSYYISNSKETKTFKGPYPTQYFTETIDQLLKCKEECF